MTDDSAAVAQNRHIILKSKVRSLENCQWDGIDHEPEWLCSFVINNVPKWGDALFTLWNAQRCFAFLWENSSIQFLLFASITQYAIRMYIHIRFSKREVTSERCGSSWEISSSFWPNFSGKF